MKSIFITLFMVCSLLLCSIAFCSDLPKQISYQGRITDALDVPITQNGLSVRFLIYPVSTGGSFVWAEVTVKNVVDGLVSHNLGSTAPFSDTLFTAFDSLWLEVLVDGEAIDPRTLLVSAPYAFRVHTEPGIAQTSTGGATIINSNTVISIRSEDIDCPAPGYVLVMASCEATVNHLNGTTSFLILDVSKDPVTLVGSHSKNWVLPTSAATGEYKSIISVQFAWPVEKGINTFHLAGSKLNASPDFSVEDIGLTLLYVPTAYGNIITSTPPLAPEQNEEINK